MRKISKRINDADYIGKTFTRLTVISTEECNGQGKQRRAISKCTCGNEVRCSFRELRTGHTKSCGCLRRETIIAKSTTHGFSRHPLNFTYSSMVNRCTNPNDQRYRDYGGRGITVCSEWLEDRTSYINWALANGWKKRLHVDRRDNNGGYSPDNCRIVTAKVNNQNRRTPTPK